jgi:hypothetical protein
MSTMALRPSSPALLRAAIVVVLWSLHPSLASAGTFTVFQKAYVRQTGAPFSVTDTFSILNPNTSYTLHVDNSGISSAVISVNGVQVLGPGDFNQNVTSIDRPVSLAIINQIAVELRSKPAASLAITIIGVDNDPPVIVASASPSPNSFNWNNTNVVVTFTCSDKTSGVASCPSPVTVSTEGANQVISGTAADRAGNTASTSITLNIEKTPPSITGLAVPPPNGAGWNNSDVTVSFICGTSISGGVQCPNPKVVSTEGAHQAISGTVTDNAGNSATASVSVSLDKTPPVLTISSPANGFVSTVSTVTVSGSATDTLSGITATTCNGVAATLRGGSFSCSVTLNAGANTINLSATDLAGNTTSTSITVTFGNVTVPAAPTGLRARPDVGQVLLTWTASTGAAGYKAKRSTTSGGPYTMLGTTTANNFVDTEVVAGNTYYYVVTAVNAKGESPNSNETNQTALDTGGGMTIQDATGGTVGAPDPNHPNSIVTIVIPPGVLGTASDTISVAFSDSPPGPLNANATAAGAHFVSRVITLSRASGLKFVKPITVTIPYDLSQVGPNDSMMVVYWDATQQGYDVVDTVGLDRVKGTITFQTVHFSQYQAVDVPRYPAALDTGFRAFTDGFSISNIETMTGAANMGACFGLTAFAKWFYQTEVPINATRLASNPLFARDTAAQDDVARELIYRGYEQTLQANKDLVWLDRQTPGDASTAQDLLVALYVTNHPQLLTLALNGSYSAPTDLHSVLVYSYSTDTASHVIHFNFYDPNAPLSDFAPNNPLRGQQIDYIINAGQFFIPPYTDPFGRSFNWVYFNALSDFFRPMDFTLAFDDASNGWPNRHFNEIVIDQASSTGLILLSPDGPDPEANPAKYQVLPGSTTFEMNWNSGCPCPKPDGSPRTQAYAHIFFDGAWKTDVPVTVPTSATGLPTPFSYTLPADISGIGTTETEMIVIISDNQYNPNNSYPYDLDYYLSQGYEGFLRIKLKLPLYEITGLVGGAAAGASTYPYGPQPYQFVSDADQEQCYFPDVLKSLYPSYSASNVQPFSPNAPLACVGYAHLHGPQPGGTPPLISPILSDSFSASLGSASAAANFNLHLGVQDISATWSISSVSPPIAAGSDNPVASGGVRLSFNILVPNPVHYHITASATPYVPVPENCWTATTGSLVGGGTLWNVQGAGTPNPGPQISSADGAFPTYNNVILVDININCGAFPGTTLPASGASFSISLTP